jgi:hypothetical protein
MMFRLSPAQVRAYGTAAFLAVLLIVVSAVFKGMPYREWAVVPIYLSAGLLAGRTLWGPKDHCATKERGTVKD